MWQAVPQKAVESIQAISASAEQIAFGNSPLMIDSKLSALYILVGQEEKTNQARCRWRLFSSGCPHYTNL